jgi:predicted MFS family arabinose efflux permease
MVERLRSQSDEKVNSMDNYVKRKNLISAKALFFTTAMCGVGWSRFQNNFYLDNGLTTTEIGTLKSVGLLLKVIGEPFWSMVADLTDQKLVFGMCMIMQVLTMEILRQSKPLTYNLIFVVKVLRTTTAPSSTLTTTASYRLTEGTNEGYGQQRMFGSLAWGGGAFIAGYLIDLYGMNALFYYTYVFNITSFLFVIFGLPSSRYSNKKKDKNSSKSNTLVERNEKNELNGLLENEYTPSGNSCFIYFTVILLFIF